MEHSHTVNGLLRKRQQVRDWLDQAQGTVTALTADIDAIDRTLRLFDVEIPADGPRIRPIPVSRHPSHRNDQSRLILSLLREHGETSLRDLTARISETRSLDAGDRALQALIRKRLACSLRHPRIAGHVESEGTGKSGVVWRVAG